MNKLVREHINEKFTEESDPIKDMGIGMIPRYEISAQEYKTLSPHNIIHNDKFITFFISLRHQPEKIYYNHKIFKNNKDFFLKNFGKHDFIFTGEYREYAWGFKIPSLILVVFTGRRGSSYYYSGEMTDYNFERIKNFLDFIFENS
jgi:hypothetical protein